MTGARPTLASTFRRAALPLGAYYAITLGVPIANGAADAGTAFVRHASVVLAVPLVLIVIAHAAHRCGVRLLSAAHDVAWKVAGAERQRPWSVKVNVRAWPAGIRPRDARVAMVSRKLLRGQSPMRRSSTAAMK